MDQKHVVVIQRELAHKVCSGFACANSFYEKNSLFKKYVENSRYISFT